MRELRLSHGNHSAPFDEAGNPTLCAMEYVAYVAGEPHSDTPKCVSPVLTRFVIALNDSLDDETRQRLRPYLVRQIGTAGDGQDEARSYMALDWLIRVYTPAFLDAAGLTEEAAKLRGRDAIESIEQARAARPEVDAIRAAAWDAAGDAGAAARDAAYAAAWAAAGAAAGAAAREALRPTIEVLQERSFELLEQMIDPAGIHSPGASAPLSLEAELFEKSGREPLVSAG